MQAAPLPATVDLIERAGADWHVLMLVGAAAPITARVAAAGAIREGDAVGLDLPLRHVQFFDSDGVRVAR